MDNINENSTLLNRKHKRSESEEQIECKDIKYSIDSWSSYIGIFHPNNILKDITNSDQFSKWSVDSKSKSEFVILKLERTSIVQLLTFGKYNDPTSLKEFKLYSGMDKNQMVEILHSTLRKEHEYETLSINYTINNKPIPSNYLKIVPIKPHNIKFNISVWFIHIRGITDERTVERCVSEYSSMCQLQGKRMWLKLTRELPLDNIDMKELNEFISNFENRNITALYNNIMKGDYESVIDVITQLKKENMLCSDKNDQCNSNRYQLEYKKEDFLYKEMKNVLNGLQNDIKIHMLSKKEEKSDSMSLRELNPSEGNENHLGYIIIDDFDRDIFIEENFFNEIQSINKPLSTDNEAYPSPRGGHSMVLDNNNNRLYLLGGWDGEKNLDDFWCFDITSSKWILISMNCQEQGGPSPLSCHRMVYDNTTNVIYLFGRYISSLNEGRNCLDVLYCYNTSTNRWTDVKVSDQIVNGLLMRGHGPGVVYDHQMVIDEKNHIIYLYGGLSFSLDNTDKTFLGLWKLDLATLCWTNLLNENSNTKFGLSLKGRAGHSMIYNEKKNEIIIIGGGQYKKKFSLSFFDIMIYEIDTGLIKEVSHDYTKIPNSPGFNFSMGVCYNSQKEQIYFFCGCQKKEKETISNHFFIFDMNSNSFAKINNKDGRRNDAIINYDILNSYDNVNYLRKGDINFDSENEYDSLNEPVQRHSACMVYSIKLNRGYIFGGNPNIKTSNSIKVNDFWSFQIKEQSTDIIEENLQFKVYCAYYEELCIQNKFDKAIEVFIDKIIKYKNCLTEEKKKELSNMMLSYDYRIYDQSKAENDIRTKRRLLYESVINNVKSEQ